jgi:hypothetical protein
VNEKARLRAGLFDLVAGVAERLAEKATHHMAEECAGVATATTAASAVSAATTAATAAAVMA